MPDDYSANTQTTGTVTVGGNAAGVIEKRGDVDWFAVELVAGRTYIIDLEGAGAGSGTLGDAMLYGLFDGEGDRVARRDRDSGEGNDARLVFTATESVTYYIAARGQRKDDTGTYTVRVGEQDAGPQQPPANTNTPQTPEQTAGSQQQQPQQPPQPPADPDATAAGAADLGDLAGLGKRGAVRKDSVDGGDDATDYYRFSLSERQAVTLSLQRQDANADLYLEDGEGTVLASSTQSGTRKDEVAATLDAGTYYVRVAAQEAGDNDYRLRAKAADPETVVETPEVLPQVQPELARSEQNSPQNVNMQQVVPTSVSEPTGSDLPKDTSTTGKVAVGGSATGAIGWWGDQDWFAVTLEAGKTYRVDVKGLYSGDGTLKDPYLCGIHDAAGGLIEGTTNNDYYYYPGDLKSFNGRVNFTPTADGTHYVSIGSDGPPIGTYTVAVNELTGDDFTAGTDTTGSVAVGGSATGEIEWRGDQDWFAVTLEAGKTYRFDLKGADTGDGTLEDPYLRGIHDAEGDLIEGTTDNDGGWQANSRVEFTTTEDGTYYVSAGAIDFTTYSSLFAGTYTLSVSEVDAM